MPKLAFSDGLTLFGVVITVVLVALDKAGKLKGPTPYILLGVAALLSVPMATSNRWVTNAPSVVLRYTRGGLLLCFLAMIYLLIAAWMSSDTLLGAFLLTKPTASQRAPATTVLGPEIPSATHSGSAEPTKPAFAPLGSIPKKVERTTENATRKPHTGAGPAFETAPPGFISFLGQGINGYAPMIQENQTHTPLDDVQLVITGVIPQTESPTNSSEWCTGQMFWQKTIEVGTVRALLTKGLDERFPIGGQNRICFHIIMMTRFHSYTEHMYLTKKSASEYEVKMEFGLPATYMRTMTLRMVTVP